MKKELVFVFIAFLASLPAFAGVDRSLPEIDSYALWKAGVAHSVEQLLSGKHQEVEIEQEIGIAASADSVMSVLADIQNYTDLYPLFDLIELHKVYQSSALEVISEFTALDRERIGHFVSEEQYFSVSVINYDKNRVDLNIWQLDRVFINIRIVVTPDGHHSRVNLVTHIQAEKDVLKQMLLNELNMPTMRIDLLKQLLEQGFISPDSECLGYPGNNRSGNSRYCF